MSDVEALYQYLANSDEPDTMDDQSMPEPLEGTFLERLEEGLRDFEVKQINKAYDRGRTMHKLMLAAIQTAGQMFVPQRKSAESEFQSVADLQRFGYSQDSSMRDVCGLSLIKIGLVLESIGLDPCFLPKVSHDNSACANDNSPHEAFTGKNIAVGHDIILEKATAASKPIISYFMQVVNPTAGLIVAYDNLSPLEAYLAESETEFDVPDLRFWSDVAFLQWKSQASEDSELNYILRHNVTNFRTNFVVEAINKANKCRTLPWPGMDYSAASEEGRALLGTPNGACTAYMLVQHKQQLGHKTVDRITVFEHKRELMLLFHIVDVEV